MKEIAIFQTDFQVGGVQRSLVNILNKIDYSKCHVDLYIFDEGCFFDMPDHENLRVIQVPPMPRWVRLVYFGLVRAFARDVTGGKAYDVAVDFNSYQHDCAVGVIKSNAKKRVKYRILWHFFKGKLPYYDAFAPVSPGLVEGFRRTTGITDKPIIPILNYIDTDEIFRKVGDPVDLEVDPGKLNLCSVGRLCHQKGYDLLLGYLAQVKKSRPEFHFYFIGDGPDRRALEDLARTLGLWENVTFLGNQPNPFPYMNKMDGFVLTSRYEGQGMVIWEAKALGLPLYISKNLEAYNPGITGYEDIPAALLAAEKPRERHFDPLTEYNDAITRNLEKILEL